MNNNNDLAQISTRFQYEDVISSCEKTKEFLAHFMEYGLAFLSNTPHQPDDLLKVKMRSWRGHNFAAHLGKFYVMGLLLNALKLLICCC